MGLWQTVKSHITNLRHTTDGHLSSLRWFPRRTYAGIAVTQDTVLAYSAVWACIHVIANPLAFISWHVRRAQPTGGSTIVSTHPTDYVLSKMANPETSTFVFRQTLTAHALSWGNGYAEIETTNGGQLAALWQLTPDRVNPVRDHSGALVYDIANPRAPNTVLPASKVFHLKGLGFDGLIGYSVIAYARQSIALGLATEKFGEEFFGNGLHPGGVVQHPGKLSATAIKNIQESLREQLKNAHDVLVLEEGMTFNATSISPDDAQFLQTRQFQLPEICRWFNVKPHKIADLSRSTNNNIEHQSIEHVQDTLLPWVEKWEQEADAKLFGGNRGNLYTKMNVSALMRGDMQSRYAAYHAGRNDGWLSANDIRELEELNPLPAHIGDTYWMPVNMVALDARGGAPWSPSPSTPAVEPSAPAAAQLLDAVQLLALDVRRLQTPPADPVSVTVAPAPISLHIDQISVALPTPTAAAPPAVHLHVDSPAITLPEQPVQIHIDGPQIMLPERAVTIENSPRVEAPAVTVNVNVEAPQVAAPEQELTVPVAQEQLPPISLDTIMRTED
jgi:HK97 family phage portal protein